MHHKWRSHDVWFLRYRQQKIEFFVIMDHFLPFDPPNNHEKIKKKPWRYCHFKIVYHKWRLYNVWFVRYQARQTYFFCLFGLFFALLPPWQPRKSNLTKMKKNFWRYHHFTLAYHKLWLDDVQFLRYGVQQMDGQTDGQTDRRMDRRTDGGKKWHIGVDALPKNW